MNEVTVKIKLVRSKDAFCIMSANDHKAVIVKSVLSVRRSGLSLIHISEPTRPY